MVEPVVIESPVAARTLRRTDAAPGPSARFGKSLAVIVGINQYGHGMAPLRSAVPDARAVAEALHRDHGFETRCLFDDGATLDELRAALRELPDALGPNDRLLLYFAGHGIAHDSDGGPAGYLIPAGAHAGEPDGFLAMREVHDALTRLAVRHALVILDCCFAGTFRWAHVRDVGVAGDPERKIYRERYDHYVDSAAWQVLTSASSDQRAFDVLGSERDDGASAHSPFARALLDGLAGNADYTGDNVITADELAMYVRERVAPAASSAGARQVPQLFALERHDGGQFVFQVPHRRLDLAPAPVLEERANPYRGLEAFREDHGALFFGRDKLVARLVDAIAARRFVVVAGPSGSGKSSLVHAGLIPAVRRRGWTVLATQRPGREPLAALDAWTRALGGSPTGDPAASWAAAAAERHRRQPARPWLAVVDQLDELVTHRTAAADRAAFLAALAAALDAAPTLHLIVTVRSDTEPAFRDTALASRWSEARFPMLPMTRDELRDIIERPARIAVLHFQPERLVEQLLDDVALVPAPLPLLSFALSELYHVCWTRWLRGVRDRALHEDDYLAMGSVAGALTRRATAVHDELVARDPAYAITIRNVFTRMISVVGGDVGRRRVPRSELIYPDRAENRRVSQVLQRFDDARLILRGRAETAGASGYVEPAHDELVRGWTQAKQWLDEIDARFGMRWLASLSDAVRDWNAHQQADAYLWRDRRLEPLHADALAQPALLNGDETTFLDRSVRRTRARRRRRVGGLVAFTVAMAILAAFALLQRQRAAAEAKRATDNANHVTRLLAQSYTEAGRQLLLDGHFQEAVPYFVAARQDGDDTPSLRMMFREAAHHLPVVPALEHRDKVLGAAFSPDGARVVTSIADHGAQLWDAATGQPLLRLPHPGMMLSAFSPDGRRIVTISSATVQIWDASTGKPTRAPLPHRGVVSGAAFSPDGTHLLTISDNTVQIWNAVTGRPAIPPLQHGGTVASAVFSADGTRVLTSSWDRTARVWDAITGAPIAAMEHPELVTSAAFSPDGNRVVTASWDKTARVWDATTGAPITAPIVHRETVGHAAFSPGGNRIVTASGNVAWVWDAATGALVTRLAGHHAVVGSAAFSPDGTRVLTTANDHTARLWDAASGEPVAAPLEHQDEVVSAAFSPDGARVVTASWDRTARIWPAGPAPARLTLEHDDKVTSATFSPDSSRVATTSGNTAWLRETATGRVLARLTAPARQLRAAFSPDGTRLVTLGSDHTARMWTPTGQLVGTLVHGRAIESVAFSPDGARAITAALDGVRAWSPATGELLAHHALGANLSTAVLSRDSTRVATTSGRIAQVWDVGTGELIATTPAHRDAILSAAFSSDGSRLATGSADQTARLWNARTGQPIAPPFEHDAAVWSVAFSPDGTRLATMSGKAARIWDALTGTPITSPLEHDSEVSSVAFSADGTRVVTASFDKTARIWDATTGKPISAPLAHHSAIASATFSPDGSHIVTASADGTARLWDVGLDNGTVEHWATTAERSPFVLSGVAHTRRPPKPEPP